MAAHHPVKSIMAALRVVLKGGTMSETVVCIIPIDIEDILNAIPSD